MAMNNCQTTFKEDLLHFKEDVNEKMEENGKESTKAHQGLQLGGIGTPTIELLRDLWCICTMRSYIDNRPTCLYCCCQKHLEQQDKIKENLG